MPIENPVVGTPVEKSKKKKIALVAFDTEDKVRDVADAKMTASKEGLTGPRLFRGEKRTSQEQLGGIKNVFQKIWKHNLFREYYRQKEIVLARKKITESGNLFVDETVNQEAHNEAMKTLVEQFASEYEETIHTEAGEKRETLGESKPEKNIKIGIKKLIADYASGIINDEAFQEERNLILSQVTGTKKSVVDKGSMYADNLWEIAKQAKESIEHGARLEELDLDFEVIVGQAKMGARTEAQYNAVDRIVQKIESSKVGRFFNEATITSAVAIAYSLSAGLSQRVAQSRLAAWGSFGATAVLGAGIAGAREGKKLEDDRRQHSREMAQGKKFDPEKSPRRKEMEEYRYESKNALDLLDNLNQGLYEYSNGERKTKKLDQGQLDIVLKNLTEIESRIALSDQNKIDLITYSRSEKLGNERLQLDIARGQAKTEIKKILDSNPGLKISNGATLREHLEALKEAKIETFITGDKGIEAKNRMFKKMKRKNVAKAAVKGLGYGLIAGSVFQEVAALARDNQEGIFEYGSEALQENAKGATGKMNYTPLEYIRRLALGELPRVNPGAMHEVIIGNQHMQLPENIDLAEAADGTYRFLRGGNILVENIQFDPDGSLTADSQSILEKQGINFKTETVAHVSEASETSGAVVEEQKDLFQKIKRKLWYDNDTPKPVFDKNELKLWWGGAKNSGVNANGEFVFNVKQMLPDGSYHGKFAVDAQEAFKEGKLKMLLSLSRNTQGSVVEIPIDANGNAIIDPNSEIGKMFFEVDNKGHAVFKGKFAEVAEIMENKDGANHVRILATHEGTESANLAPVAEKTPIAEKVPVVEKVPHTVFDFPEEYNVDSPLVIPIFGRAPLEPNMAKKTIPDSLGGGYFKDNQKNLERWEKDKSPRLKENSNVKLLQKEEIDWYFEKQEENMGNDYTKEIDSFIEKQDMLKSMSSNTEIIVCIPVAAAHESENIYNTLKLYSKQNKKSLDKATILMNVNWIDDANMEAVDRTLSEIERAKKDLPNLKLAYFKKEWKRDWVKSREDRIYGAVVKYLNDTALKMVQKKNVSGDVYLLTNDADCRGMSKRYLETLLRGIQRTPHADGFLGRIEWGSEIFDKYPGFHVSARFMEYIDSVYRNLDSKIKNVASSGANFLCKASTFAAVGGYDFDMGAGADTDLGRRIKRARLGSKREFEKEKYPIRYNNGAWIDTDPSRALKYYLNGIPIIKMWDKFDDGGYRPRGDLSLSEGTNENLKTDFDLIVKRIEYQISMMISEWVGNENKNVYERVLDITFPPQPSEAGGNSMKRLWNIVENGNGARIILNERGKAWLKKRLIEFSEEGKKDTLYRSRGERANS